VYILCVGKGSFGGKGKELRSRVHVVGGVFYVRLNQLVFNPLFLPDNNKRLTAAAAAAAAKNNTIIITRPFRVRFRRRRHRCRRRRFHIIYIHTQSNAAWTIIAHVVISPEKRSVTISLRSLFRRRRCLVPFSRNPSEQNILRRVCVLSILYTTAST